MNSLILVAISIMTLTPFIYYANAEITKDQFGMPRLEQAWNLTEANSSIWDLATQTMIVAGK